MNEWISVNDKLPSEGDGTVLICMPDVFPYNEKEHFVNAKHDNRVCVGKYSEYSDVWYFGDFNGMRETRPTHWMPLPQPPLDNN